MELLNLIDPGSAAIVTGGTTLATALRTGLAGCKTTALVCWRLGTGAFDADGLRADLARLVQEVNRSGLLRAEPFRIRDRPTEQAASAMISARSVDRFRSEMQRARSRRRADYSTAYRAFCLGADNAPAFGLAGTLLALTQMAGGQDQPMSLVLAAAVLTTLYGVIFGQLVLAPIAEAIRRAGQREDAARADLLAWTMAQMDRPVFNLPSRANAA